MTASAILRYDGVLYPLDNLSSNSSTSNNSNITLNPNFIANNLDDGRILVSMCLTFIVGILQVTFPIEKRKGFYSCFSFKIIFAIFHVGFVAKYLSDSIVAGFTTGAAIHIVVSQIGSLLGYKTKKSKLMFKLVGVINNIHA